MSPDCFSPFFRRQRDDLERVRDQPLSLTHGLAVSPERLVEVEAAMATFLTSWDVDACTGRIVDALS